MANRSILSTLNIIALTAVLLSFAAYFYIQPRLQARPTSYTQTILQDDSVSELVAAQPWLVVYELNPSPVFSNTQQRFAIDSQQISLNLSEDNVERIQAILAALKNRMSSEVLCANSAEACSQVLSKKSIWPEALGIPEVFLSNFGSAQEIVILNFPLASDIQISIHQEEALKTSITETLNRNNIANSLWLINDEPRPLFLQHIALQTDLQ